MAYFDELMKKEMELEINPILKEYNVDGYLEVLHDNSVCIHFTSGVLNLNRDKFGNLAPYKMELYDISEKYDGKCEEFLNKIVEVLDSKNYDVYNDEGIQIDVGYFVYGTLGDFNYYYTREK